MDEDFALPVSYGGRELEYRARLLVQGYTYRIAVEMDGVEVSFEKDDSGEFRAVIHNPDAVTGKLPERGLLEAVSGVIQGLVG